MEQHEVLEFLKNNPACKKLWLSSKKREIYTKSGAFIIKKVIAPSGTVESVEIFR